MSSPTCSLSGGYRREMTNSNPTRKVSPASSYDRSHSRCSRESERDRRSRIGDSDGRAQAGYAARQGPV